MVCKWARFVLLAVAVASVLLEAATAQENWRQWRGPARNGHVPPSLVPERWPARLERVWRREVGSGHSSPVVDGERAYTLTRVDAHEVVTALRLTDGEPVWTRRYAAEIGINRYADDHGRWPRSTPLVHDGRLVTLGASAALIAWDAATGEQQWRRDVDGGVDTSNLFCGTSVSPLLHDGVIFAHVGDDSGGELVAARLADGTDAWKTRLEGPGYASPVLARIGAVRQLITLTKSRVIGVSVADGEVLWSVPFEDKWNENIVTPVVVTGAETGDEIVVVAGVRRGMLALRPKPAAGEWSVETVWAERGTTLYMSSPVLDGGVLLGFSQKRRGSFVAVDVADGRTLWEHRERAENAALLRAGPHLLALTTEGELQVARASREGFEVERRYNVADTATWAHPVPVAGGLLVKDATAVAFWRAAPRSSPEPKRPPVSDR